MKKILKNTKKTQKYIGSLPRIYIVACWARYGTRGFAFTGKYEVNEYGVSVPLVYDYDDHNGTCDNYYLRKITSTTTGSILFWTQNVYVANMVADVLNRENSRKKVDKYLWEVEDESN